MIDSMKIVENAGELLINGYKMPIIPERYADKVFVPLDGFRPYNEAYIALSDDEPEVMLIARVGYDISINYCYGRRCEDRVIFEHRSDATTVIVSPERIGSKEVYKVRQISTPSDHTLSVYDTCFHISDDYMVSELWFFKDGELEKIDATFVEEFNSHVYFSIGNRLYRDNPDDLLVAMDEDIEQVLVSRGHVFITSKYSINSTIEACVINDSGIYFCHKLPVLTIEDEQYFIYVITDGSGAFISNSKSIEYVHGSNVCSSRDKTSLELEIGGKTVKVTISHIEEDCVILAHGKNYLVTL